MVAIQEPEVVFNELDHTYTTPNGRQLSGVTALLHRQLFEDKYDGIPKQIMEAAAERGNIIHRQIEILETLGVSAESMREEVQAYVSLKEECKFETIATELLVSDDMNVASAIDVVWAKDGTIALCDIKTTSKLDMDYLSWQLSIYKHLFLLHNPIFASDDINLFAC